MKQQQARKFYDALDELLDRPIAYNPSFRRITGSTVAAVLLSQGFYWSKRTTDPEGWFYKSGLEWEEETGLSRSEQETARRICRDTGVMEEKLKGVPATMHYRVVKARVYELLGFQFAGTLQTEIAGTPQTENAETPQTGMQDNSKPVSGIPPIFNKETETTAGTTQGLPADEVSDLSDQIHGNLAWLAREYTSNIGLIHDIYISQEIGEYSQLPREWLEYGFDQMIAAREKGPVQQAWGYVKACVETCRKNKGVPAAGGKPGTTVSGYLDALAKA